MADDNKYALMLQDKVINKTTYAKKGDKVLIIKYTGQFDPLIVEHPVSKQRFSITFDKIEFL